jgi:hypothetical protein
VTHCATCKELTKAPTQTHTEKGIRTRLILATAMAELVTKSCSLLVIVQTARTKVAIWYMGSIVTEMM